MPLSAGCCCCCCTAAICFSICLCMFCSTCTCIAPCDCWWWIRTECNVTVELGECILSTVTLHSLRLLVVELLPVPLPVLLLQKLLLRDLLMPTHLKLLQLYRSLHLLHVLVHLLYQLRLRRVLHPNH